MTITTQLGFVMLIALVLLLGISIGFMKRLQQADQQLAKVIKNRMGTGTQLDTSKPLEDKLMKLQELHEAPLKVLILVSDGHYWIQRSSNLDTEDLQALQHKDHAKMVKGWTG